MNLKRCFIDIETSGLDIYHNGILQIAGIIEIDYKVVNTFNFNCQLFPDQVADEEALKVNRYTAAQILSFDSPYDTLVKLLRIFDTYVDKYNKYDKFSFIGYNSSTFDMPWMRVFFKNCNHKYFGSYFWNPSIDVMYNASSKLESVRNSLPNFKLETVAKFFIYGIKEDETHDAAYDIELTRKLFYELENYKLKG